jgi:hypothetical protein
MNNHTCKHYNGDHHNKACDAGVLYRSVTTDPDNNLGIAFRKPCVLWDKRKAGQPLSDFQLKEWERRGACSKFELPTKEEIAAYEKEMEAHTELFMVAVKAVEPIRKHYKGKNYLGTIECPICKGELVVRHAACNGHIWAKCKTEGCVSWVE